MVSFTFLTNLASPLLLLLPLPWNTMLIDLLITRSFTLPARLVLSCIIQDTYKYVSGDFIIPTFHSGILSVFVGIDGRSYGVVNLQVGVTFFTDGRRPNPWYTWYGYSGPYAFTDNADLDFEVGDLIKLGARMTSHRFGTVFVENTNKTLFVTQDVSWPVDTLCGQDAMWIVSPSDPLVTFDTFVFSEVVATTSGGMIGPEDADAYTIMPNQNFATTVAVTSSTITIQHLV